MRGGLERWKRGVASQGVKQAVAYAFEGACDSHLHQHSGADALAKYSDSDAGVTRFVVEDGAISRDELDAKELARWVEGEDPETGERRGRDLASPDADLVLDGTINAPKSYSLAALINEDLAAEFEALQDRLRDRIITTWQRELNARRGAGGLVRESLSRIEVVELQHRRSRALDPHIHRHLWLNVRVLGEDGRWSNVDSRVAMKLHTVINAEGELAAKTDPEWVAALARNGYTLDADGEIAELAGAVRPLSRRSNQIEANRAVLIAEWQSAHPGQEPDRDVLQQIDRRAWAQGRPNKPGDVDEESWEQMAREEISGIDPTLLERRSPAYVRPTDLAAIDRDLLAAMAVVEADNRSASTGGRFSLYDVRAGAMRALSRSGIVIDRALLEEMIEDITARSIEHTIDMLDGETDVPPHIKGFMSTSTAGLKLDLAARFDRLNEPGVVVPDEDMTALAEEVLEEGRTLDVGQTAAAGAIAGTDRLVTITGPAGTGKTTMLKVAKRALEGQGRRLVVVAPTKKAASVAGREVGADASSLHALLVDYGWRWSQNEAGAAVWHQLQPGDADPLTGRVYGGPRRYPLQEGDRIVVDEAGMVDLHTANALAQLAEQTGAGIAMVGDHLQAMPVGHSGAMATMQRRSRSVELTAVHRFRTANGEPDLEYAELSLRLREPGSTAAAVEVARDLQRRGHVRRVETEGDARQQLVDAYFQHEGRGERVALVTSTNAEAQAISEEIQQRRVDAGKISVDQVAVGQNEQRILVGDIVQTRRNDRDSDVENRALWTVAAIRPDGSVHLVSIGDSGDTRDVTADYLADHVHLAYASTVHGIQGETTDAAVVGPGVDASGLYVGMTRGRKHNTAVVIARNEDEAVAELASTMMRGTPEVAIDDSIRAAHAELGRAARRPAQSDAGDASWDDGGRRPVGAIIDLERWAASAEEKIVPLRQNLEQTIDAIARDRDRLAQIDARLRELEAKNHASAATERLTVDDTGVRAARERVAERLAEATEKRKKLGSQYSRLVRMVDAVPVELQLRAGLSPEQLADEERRRLQHARTARSTDSGPFTRPETPRPGMER